MTLLEISVLAESLRSLSIAPLLLKGVNKLLATFHWVGIQNLLKSKLRRTDRRTFLPRFRWEILIHIWISPRHWKDASGEKRSLGSDTLYVFLCLETITNRTVIKFAAPADNHIHAKRPYYPSFNS